MAEADRNDVVVWRAKSTAATPPPELSSAGPPPKKSESYAANPKSDASDAKLVALDPEQRLSRTARPKSPMIGPLKKTFS